MYADILGICIHVNGYTLHVSFDFSLLHFAFCFISLKRSFGLTFSHSISPIILIIPPQLLSLLILKVLQKIHPFPVSVIYLHLDGKAILGYIYSVMCSDYLRKLSLHAIMSLQLINILSISSTLKTKLSINGFSKT